MTNRRHTNNNHAKALHQTAKPHPFSSAKTPRRKKLSSGPVQVSPQHQGVKLDTSGVESQLRRDYLHEYYVLISPNRGRRPYDTTTEEHHLIETIHSPRLDEQDSLLTINDNSGQWLVKVVANKYPALTPMNPEAYGMQEIVIDTPLSCRNFASLGAKQIVRVLSAFVDRISKLFAQKSIEYVVVFHNEGYSAGASLAHAHSQVVALPIIPPKIQAESSTIEAYSQQKNQDPFEDIISYERESGKRLIAEDDNWLVFCPYASQWPFETWILPKKTITSSRQMNADQIISLAHNLKQICSKLTRHQISYNFYFEEGISPHHRFCVKVCGRSGIWGGLEVATGIIINTVPPEAAAKWYRS